MTSIPHATRRRSLPTGFLWGAASSAHQTEGGNTNSNWWHLEQAPNSPLAEPSGDAVDSYRRYPEDMRLLAEAGLDTYRFSIEWARIEPRQGEIDAAQLDHYRRMIVTCRDAGLTPVVTLHHFTSPMWFTQLGGWRGPDAVAAFVRFVDVASTILEDVPWVCTINEPNMVALAANLFSRGAVVSPRTDERSISALALNRPADDVAAVMTQAHRAAVDILHRRTDAHVGWTVSNQAFEADAGCEAVLEHVRWAWEDRFLEVSREDDFVGVQAYTAQRVGPAGPIPHPPSPDNTLTGWPVRPDALATAIRHTWQVTGGVPILVTEHGIATADDEQREAFLDQALEGLVAAVADGVDVRGYLHWSLMDNFEWFSGYAPKFGLVAEDRETFVRTPKPSLAWLGEVARRNAL
jgi:beta-glucosidase